MEMWVQGVKRRIFSPSISYPAEQWGQEKKFIMNLNTIIFNSKKSCVSSSFASPLCKGGSWIEFYELIFVRIDLRWFQRKEPAYP